MTNAFNIDELILRVLDGVATPDEIQTLAQWLKASPENEVYFNQLKKAWNLTSGPIPAKERVEYELGNYMKYIRSKHRKYSIGQLVKYAAIVMIPLLSVIYWLQLEKDEIPSQMAVGNSGIMPGEHKAMLITAQGQTIALLPSLERDICVQEDLVVKNGQAGIVYQDSKKAVSTLQYNTLKTPRGGEYTVVLSDGTKVYLNAASELKYPVQFDSKKRQVHLSGEAYFEVTRDTNRPFYVVTDAVRVKVYGTEFNVKAYSDEMNVQTTLLQGVVTVFSGLEKKEKMEIKPNQQAEWCRRSVKMRVREVDPDLFMAWKNGRFIFRQDRLEDIMRTLARWYGVEVVYLDESVKSMLFAGKLDRSEEITPILDVLRTTDKLSVDVKGKKIVIGLK